MTSKDLGVKIGTHEEKAWTDILKHAELEIEQGRRENAINNAIITLAKEKITKEKRKI